MCLTVVIQPNVTLLFNTVTSHETLGHVPAQLPTLIQLTLELHKV